MTQKQFKEALLRGQGRCVKAVRKNPERYRKVVLWACSHEVAFDTQCEGSKAWFVYQLILAYSDTTPFVEKAIESLDKAKSNYGWKMLYLAELLDLMAEDGWIPAKDALWRKYEQLYAILINRKRPKYGVFEERDDYAMLCQVLAWDKESLARIAEDVGRLYRLRTFYDGYYFDWLYDAKAKPHIKYLERLAKKSENIAAYLAEGKAQEETFQKKWESPVRERPRQGIALSIWLRNKADAEIVMQYANEYLNAVEPDERAKALDAFRRCPFPLEPLPIIEDASSEFEPLKEAAILALENVRHPDVRAFALQNVDEKPESYLPLLVRNYELQDEELLTELIESVQIDWKCSTPWHGLQLDVLRMKDYSLKAPGRLLAFIYENTYCSCCRERALVQMGRRRLVTAEMLQECLYDSNEDIREYARKRMKKK